MPIQHRHGLIRQPARQCAFIDRLKVTREIDQPKPAKRRYPLSLHMNCDAFQSDTSAVRAAIAAVLSPARLLIGEGLKDGFSIRRPFKGASS